LPEITVVVPAFRERENIPRLLDALEQALGGLDWETIVVVDDAEDGSEELVRARAQHDPRVRCIQRIGRRGLASACIEGMLASSAPYVAVMDADLQHDETLVPKLPRETELLILISNAFVRWWYLMLGIPAIAVIGAWFVARTSDSAQRRLSELSLRLPVLGPIRQKIILARFSTFFAMLYRAGISVIASSAACGGSP